MFLPVEKFSSIDFVFIYAVDDKVVFFDSVYFTPEANVGEFVVCLRYRIEKNFGLKISEPENFSKHNSHTVGGRYSLRC